MFHKIEQLSHNIGQRIKSAKWITDEAEDFVLNIEEVLAE